MFLCWAHGCWRRSLNRSSFLPVVLLSVFPSLFPSLFLLSFFGSLGSLCKMVLSKIPKAVVKVRFLPKKIDSTAKSSHRHLFPVWVKWLVVWNPGILNDFPLGISSSQLTLICFRGGRSTTNQLMTVCWKQLYTNNSQPFHIHHATTLIYIYISG